MTKINPRTNLAWVILFFVMTACNMTAIPPPSPTVARPTPTTMSTSVPPTPIPRGHIAFIAQDGLYVVNADGSGLTNLAQSVQARNGFAWSPDGMHIAFIDSNEQICVVDVNDNKLIRLTTSMSTIGSRLTWSPDGTRIVFTRWGEPKDRDLYMISADGSSVTKEPLRIRLDAPTDIYVDAAWSPDGIHLAFGWWTRMGNHGIEVIDVETRKTFSIGLPWRSLSGVFDPNWSPDGKRIAYSDANIFVANADGSGQVQLTNSPTLDFRPMWSPDGTHIVFISNLDTPLPYMLQPGDTGHDNTPGNYRIYIMRADGANKTLVTNHPALAVSPAWSPKP